MSARSASTEATPSRAPHPLLRAAIEVPSENSRIEWNFSQLLSSHQASLEAVVSEQVRKCSEEADERIDRLKQQIGHLGDHLSRRLDSLHGEGVGARTKVNKRLAAQEDKDEENVLKTLVDRLQKVENMEAQILNTLGELGELMGGTSESAVSGQDNSAAQAGSKKDGPAAEDVEMMELPVVQRMHDRVAKMHERLLEKHEESLAKLHLHHVGILQERMQTVKNFGPQRRRSVHFRNNHSNGASSEEQRRLTSASKVEPTSEDSAVGDDGQEDPEVVMPKASTGSVRSVDVEASNRCTDGSSPRAGGVHGSVHAYAMMGSQRDDSAAQALTVDVNTLKDLQGWRKARSSDLNRVGLERFRKQLESYSSFFIIMNILYLGVETEFSMAAAQKGERSPLWLWWVSLAFAIIFIVELLFRLAMEKWAFFSGPHWKWNMFDSILVLVQVVDIAFAVINLSFVRAVRCLRSVRALRIIRAVAYVRELRLMIASIGASFTSLMWSFVLLILVLYLFSLGLEQTIVAHIEISGPSNIHQDLAQYYGSLGSAMVTLFMAISGGMDWADLVAPLYAISPAYLIFFMGFITFTLFGMLNILTAVFVEATNRIAEVDQDLVIQDHLDHENSVIGKVREYLAQADTDGSGTISKVEFDAKLSDHYFQAQLKLLELDSYEAQGVFKILNIHETDEVEIEEFIYGLIRLKGNAKAVDVVTMLCESKRIVRRLAAFMRYTEDNFRDLREDLGLCVRPNKDMKTYLSASTVGPPAALKP